MRRRYAPWRVSAHWSRAARPTDAEGFVREVSLRWERAAEELEELLRSRRHAPERGSSGLRPEDDAPSAPPAGPRGEPPAIARRARGIAGAASGMERARAAAAARDPSGGLEEREEPMGPEGASPPAGKPGSAADAAHPQEVRARKPARRDPSGTPARGEDPGAGEPVTTGARREALRDGRAPPSPGRGETGAGALDAPASAPAFPREQDLFEADPAGEHPDVALPVEGFPRRVPVERRAAGDDGPRDRARREGEQGFLLAAARSGELPEEGAGAQGSARSRSPGRREPSIESLLDEARRRAEAIAEWERTGF